MQSIVKIELTMDHKLVDTRPEYLACLAGSVPGHQSLNVHSNTEKDVDGIQKSLSNKILFFLGKVTNYTSGMCLTL